MGLDEDLFEHIDGLRSCDKAYTTYKILILLLFI